MEGNISVSCAAVLLLLSVILASADPINNDRNSILSNQASDKKLKASGFWIGARMGRRKRNPKAEDVIYRAPVLEGDQLAELMEAIQDSPWAIVAIKEGKRDFTPRLGRDSGEELVNAGSQAYGGPDRWLQQSDLIGDLVSQRSPPFAPRLGRQAWYSGAYNPTPRLGRKI